MPLTDQQLRELSAGLDSGKTIHEIKLTPRPPKKKRNNEESRQQRAFFMWWNLVGANKFKLHPCLMHSVPNGGFRSVVTASIMKAEGQRRGVYDIKLNVARGIYHGAWIEMKAEKGVLSDDQNTFSDAVIEQGYFTAVCYTADQAMQCITKYLNQ